MNRPNLQILFTVALALVGAFVLFHYKTVLGILVLPLFIALVLFVTLRFYRLMEKDDPRDQN
ncbi:hypothetical protein [Shewanella zhangzhouensis]|uniref:hypothetical protein n=1 Tax=Shewanella zhangzhouensis TaxID=2864213 RepID=UPI001C65A50E|nr:hypothetical protein [Shewanella zhangzhouensis]QYK06978.1 hypothetical protein K0H63_09370 [Shewanella zhangzhouensis]